MEHCAAQSGHVEVIKTILTLYPESERLQVLNMKNRREQTVLHCARNSILELLSRSENLVLKRSHNSVIDTTEEDDVEQPEAKRQRT